MHAADMSWAKHVAGCLQTPRRKQVCTTNCYQLLETLSRPPLYLGRHDALLRVEVGGRLVNEVDVCRLAHAQRERHTLQLTTCMSVTCCTHAGVKNGTKAC